MNTNKKLVFRGFVWKVLERFGVLGIQFVLQLVLARILTPEHYGALSMMIIFTSLANVFIQRGFNTALIQNKDENEDDYSSVFWITLIVAGIFYVILFFAAPYIASFYNMPDIVAPFRCLALILFPGAFNSIQLAKVSREFDFKKVFVSNLGAIITAGITGIVIALLGGGIWALVANNLVNVFVACIVMFFTVKWRPRFVIDFKRIKILFSFGWKLLVSGIIDTLYQDIRSLVIGKKYNSGTLGFYNRGKQFPQFIIGAVNGAVQSVMLPAMSVKQEKKNEVKQIMRRSISVSAYIIFPMMAGLAACASPIVSLLLTDKWLPCVPYMQIYCFTLAFYPVHSCNLQAINAIGRSDMFLKLELIKKAYGLLLLTLAVFCFDSPIAIALTGVITTFISCFVNSYPNKKLVGYSYFEQMKDILPAFVLSIFMAGCVYAIQFIGLNNILTLFIQVPVGVLVYIAGSKFFHLDGFDYVLNLVKSFIKKKS